MWWSSSSSSCGIDSRFVTGFGILPQEGDSCLDLSHICQRKKCQKYKNVPPVRRIKLAGNHDDDFGDGLGGDDGVDDGT